MKDKLRFLATGDFHSDKSLIKKIEKNVDFSKIDFVIFTGDLSDKKNDFKELLNIFKDKQIFMVPGNHESKKQLEILKTHYKIHMIGNAPIKVNEHLAIFGTNYINIGPYGINEDEVLENLLLNFKAIEEVKFKVHLSHIPPSGTKIGDASPFEFIGGSKAVRSFLDNFNPDLSLVGHIHESRGLEEIVNKTRVVNVGRTYKIFEFDFKDSKLSLKN